MRRDDLNSHSRWAFPEVLGDPLFRHTLPREERDIRDAHLVRSAPKHIGETIRQDETEIVLSDEILDQSRERKDDHGVQCTRSGRVHQLPIDRLKAPAGNIVHLPKLFGRDR
jgi:hypothetical protein